MANNRGAADTLGQLIIENLRESGAGSAICQFLEFTSDQNGGLNIPVNIARQRFCDPPPPPPPPTADFFNAGGVPCRDYRVIFETGAPGGPGTPSEVIKPGPIGSITNIRNNPDGSVNKQIILSSGDGINCPRNFDVMAGTSDARFVDVFARIISVTPVTPDPPTEIPIYIPVLQPPPEPAESFAVDFNVNLGGVEINVPLFFAPPIITNIGVSIPFTFAPTANFNPQIDINLGSNPQFAIDLDLEFIIPLGGDPDYPVPVPGVEPIPLPPVNDAECPPCPEFDYERIEEAIEEASCCKPVAETDFIASFLFETTSDVFTASIADNAEYVSIDIIPDNNSRRYKLAGPQAEIALGNAAITSNGHVLSYEKIYTRRHILKVPANIPNPGIRVSLKQGCQITVEALLHGV